MSHKYYAKMICNLAYTRLDATKGKTRMLVFMNKSLRVKINRFHLLYFEIHDLDAANNTYFPCILYRLYVQIK